ncbi:MAG: D-glycero-beta-D-manno-heptose-7-phosphate kinase [Helicobacteraceae bacterium]|jgi:D-beta-D-heptose 7-phosphate kinase/D-beta-D-heptose 1-phosphate adenosyltransferase|nr:D-glycero-beta-D-manno-heptose-7-phosphate kinase [Helicobacteraceae bacterium]
MIRLKQKAPKTLVVGDLMLDTYLWGRSDRISPEAPVPVVDIEKTTVVLGGAGNVLNNLLSLGAVVFAAGVIGDDETGAQLKSILKQSAIDTSALIVQQGRKSSRKTRVMAAHQQIVRFDSESKDAISGASEEALKAKVLELLNGIDICLISDYGKGVLTASLTQFIIDKAKSLGKKVLIDPKGSDYAKYKHATLITPNRKEAGEALGRALTTLEAVKEAGAELRRRFEIDRVIITLSESGMMICSDDGCKHIPTQAREVYDVTGAGDTVLASLGIALANNMQIDEAAHFANIAAAVVVSKLGSATVTIDEAIAYDFRHSISSRADKVITLDQARLESLWLKKSGRRVVFTNGCFDLLHRGHIDYLRRSRAEGDALFVGLNSDASIKKLKGSNRPITCGEDRAFLLGALSFVDYIIMFDDPTPIELVKAIRPDVITKGADYAGKEVVGSEYAKEVILLDLIEGRSTTNTIAKIKELNQC